MVLRVRLAWSFHSGKITGSHGRNYATCARLESISRYIANDLSGNIGQANKTQYNKKLTEIKLSQDGVLVSFQDGSSATGTTLVGCDGARSKVRDFLLGPEKAAVTILPYEAYFSTFKYPAETTKRFRKLHQIHTTALHPDGMFCGLGRKFIIR